jgi:hypothetical protein
MFKILRVPEKLFALVMWLVSLAFAAFLIGLGSKIVADLPRLEARVAIEDFVQPPGALAPLRAQIESGNTEQRQTQARLEQAQCLPVGAQRPRQLDRDPHRDHRPGAGPRGAAAHA